MFSESEIFFNLMFALLTYVFVYPPKEFIASDLSIEQLAIKFGILPSQPESFVHYQARRIAINMLLHSGLPAAYLTIYDIQFNGVEHFTYGKAAWVSHLWTTVTCIAWLLLAATFVLCTYWVRFDRHPLIGELRKYANVMGREGQTWEDVASSIDVEYRRMEKIVLRVNTITTVLATENWVIKTTPYWVNIAHQDDSALIVIEVS